MNKKLVVLLLVVALVLTSVAGLAGCKPKVTEKVKVGFIYVGPIGDGGYTFAHNEGRKYLEEKLGDKVTTMYIENVPETVEAQTKMEYLISQGCTIIFATSFGHGPHMIEVAKKNPNVKFFHCSGSDKVANSATYFGRMYQGRYLAGITAGKATKTNKIGYVAAYPIPEVIRGINAFTIGVRSVNPSATVKVVWTNTWFDPNLERQAAESLLSAGCDVMEQHQDTTEPVAAAKNAGAYSIGYNSSMAVHGGEKYLTSPMFVWGIYYEQAVKNVLDGKFKSEDVWMPMSSGIVKLDNFGSTVTQETKDIITAKQKDMKDGTWDVFWGPIKDQSGAVKVADGAKMTDSEIWNMMWFVEGVDGTIPNN